MSYRVNLTRVSNGSALRTDSVEGHTENLPEEGRAFALIGESLTPGGLARLVSTSPVREIIGSFGPAGGPPCMVLFETQNSTYRVDILE